MLEVGETVTHRFNIPVIKKRLSSGDVMQIMVTTVNTILYLTVAETMSSKFSPQQEREREKVLTVRIIS